MKDSRVKDVMLGMYCVADCQEDKHCDIAMPRCTLGGGNANDDMLQKVKEGDMAVTDLVLCNGHLVSKASMQKLGKNEKVQSIPMPNDVLYAWYDGDEGRALFFYELESLEKFRRDYNHPKFNYNAHIRKDGIFEVLVDLPYNAGRGWDTWKFQMLYDANHPTKTRADTIFGGSIKIYPISPSVEGYHHMYSHNGRPFVCQHKEGPVEEVNAYAALHNVMRWLAVFYIWKYTGVDVDIR